ncbi:aspartate kinase [Vagococcus teuberi]|uniref:Aspartokinase n=1 Tax=Vagococcus teuberi TaxID=519472 RepID=A0A1J0A631_9ENTE|nr:aspartate kinase [Vagococcus teuberi]APB31397.1 aspartate kinase [Vagococcus teuberi]
MIKVTKFGGSSVANATQFKKVKNIIDSDPTRTVVVTSASGKEQSDDHKMTDLLYLCYEHKRYGMPFDDLFQMIRDKLTRIEDELDLESTISEDLDFLYQKLSDSIDIDYLVSRGEYLTAKLLSNYLGFKFVDAKDIIIFKPNGQIDEKRSCKAIQNLIKESDKIVVPGFYGAYPDKSIHLMSRGGSDITGSFLANVMDAVCYENWTDVSGILKADPRIVNNPKQIETITYEELRELAYMGANVIHEEAVNPVRQKGIPIHILNTNDPQNRGTVITAEDEQEKRQAITGITGKKDFSIITVVKSHMSNDFGTIRKALECMEKYRIIVEHIPTGVDSFSLVVETAKLKPFYYEVISDLKASTQADKVSVIHDFALIAIVSRFMKNKTGMSGRLFSALGEQQINISLISQTSDELTIIIGVKNEDYNTTIQTIYYEFEGDDSL